MKLILLRFLAQQLAWAYFNRHFNRANAKTLTDVKGMSTVRLLLRNLPTASQPGAVYTSRST